MTRLSIGNRLTPYLAFACLALAGLVALEWQQWLQTETDTWHNPKPAAASRVESARADFSAPPLATFNEILERPLFKQGRQPPEQPPATAPRQPRATNGPLNLRLEGIALTPQTKLAVVRDVPSNKVFRLTEGQKYRGWLVEGVHEAGATLKQGQQTRELKLELAKNAPRKVRQRAGVPARTLKKVPSLATTPAVGIKKKPAQAPVTAAELKALLEANSKAIAQQLDAAGKASPAGEPGPDSPPSTPSPK